MGRLRIGVAGAGFIGGVHARAARRAGAQLIAVAASDPQRSKVAAEALDAERGAASPEELVTAGDLDVLHVATPNHLHLPLARLALEHGMHVVCEKPLTTEGATARELAALAARQGVIAAVPFVYRFYPTVRELRARLRSGEAGPLRLIHGSYLQDWMSTPEDYSWRVDPDLGGPSRAFADIGSHWCDLVEFASGQRIARLLARTHTLVDERTVDPHRAAFGDEGDGGSGARAPVRTEDAASVWFETESGAPGSLLVSQVSVGRRNALTVSFDGADAALWFDQEAPESLWVGTRGELRQVRRDPSAMTPDADRLSLLPPGHPQGYQDCFDAFVADAYAAIGGQPPEGLPTFDDGARAVAITDAVLASARTGAWVEVEPSQAPGDH